MGFRFVVHCIMSIASINYILYLYIERMEHLISILFGCLVALLLLLFYLRTTIRFGSACVLCLCSFIGQQHKNYIKQNRSSWCAISVRFFLMRFLRLLVLFHAIFLGVCCNAHVLYI